MRLGPRSWEHGACGVYEDPQETAWMPHEMAGRTDALLGPFALRAWSLASWGKGNAAWISAKPDTGGLCTICNAYRLLLTVKSNAHSFQQAEWHRALQRNAHSFLHPQPRAQTEKMNIHGVVYILPSSSLCTLRHIQMLIKYPNQYFFFQNGITQCAITPQSIFPTKSEMDIFLGQSMYRAPTHPF